jgi:uncharacterized protein
MSDVASIAIEIVEAFADGAHRETVRVRAGASLADALACATSESVKRALDELARIDHVADSNVGVWGRRALATTALHDGDRIELYRAVTADAKSARLARAREQGYRWQGRTRRVAQSQK